MGAAATALAFSRGEHRCCVGFCCFCCFTLTFLHACDHLPRFYQAIMQVLREIDGDHLNERGHSSHSLTAQHHPRTVLRCKAAVVGDARVGKSSLLRRWLVP